MNFFKMGKKNEKGFTLVELLVVIAIIGILAAVIAPNVFAQIERGKISAVVSEYRAVKTAAILVNSDSKLTTDDAGINLINDLLEKKMLGTGAAEAPFSGNYALDDSGKFLLVPNVPKKAGESIAKTIANIDAGDLKVYDPDDVADVYWVTDNVATDDKAGTLAIRLVQ